MTPADEVHSASGSAAPRLDDPATEVVRFGLDGDGDATFQVSVRRRAGAAERFDTRLTTVSGRQDRIRHGYAIETYSTADTAIERAEAFVDLLDRRVRDGDVSSDDPTAEAVQDVIGEFTGPGIGARLLGFFGRLGRTLKAQLDETFRRG